MTTSAISSRSVNMGNSLAGAATAVARRSSRFHLPAGGVMRIEKDSRAGRIRVAEGKLWITSTPAVRDFVLGAGQSMPLQAEGPFIVEALASAQFEVAGD